MKTKKMLEVPNKKAFLIRCSKQLHSIIKLEATKQHTSMLNYILTAVIERIKTDQSGDSNDR